MNQKNGIGQKDDLLSLDPKYFGPFWDYIQNDEITDVDFNGTDLWITDSQNRRTKIENHGITTDFIEAFSQRVSNQVSKEFNRNENLLEAETKTLRISILHESAAVSGRSVCLRKSLPKVRMTAKSIVESSYMPRPILNLLTNCIMSKMNMVVGGEPGAGKDLADSTPVPVPISEKYPTGWAKHGDLKPGDQVYAPDGSIVEIDYVTPGRDLNLYEVAFSDGQVIKASDTHLWRVSTHEARRRRKEKERNRERVDTVFDTEQQRLRTLAMELADKMMVADAQTIAAYAHVKKQTILSFLRHIALPFVRLEGHGGRKAWPVDEALSAWADHLSTIHQKQCSFRVDETKTLSTQELAEQVVMKDGRLNWAVKISEPLDGHEVTLPMDPYVLGVWLGDGHSYGGQITIFDKEIEYQLNKAGFFRISERPTGQAEDVTFDGLWNTLKQTVSFAEGSTAKLEKRIPPIYLRASKAQRLALLQGLMDADGSVDKKGRCEFCSSNEALALDVCELIRSMGIKTRIRPGVAAMTITDAETGEKNRKECGLRYRMCFTTTLSVFRLERKAKRLPTVESPRIQWNYIVAIRPVPSERGRCIHVVHPEHLYLAGGFIPTHNTESAKFFTQFIPDDQRVITIEDSPEWHYHTINPTHDCVEMRVNPQFSYAKAIKTCLRQNPKWIMLSEARSVEAKYLIEAWSTGVNGVTTIHTDDIRKIASRLLNMMGTREDADRLENDIYDFVNVVFLVRRKAMPDGTARRYIDQMGFFYRDEYRQNKVTMLVKNGEMISDWLPPDIAFKLSWMGIEKPFECEVIDSLIGDVFFYTPMTTTEAVSLKPEPSALESTATVVEKAMPVIPKAEVKQPSKPKPVRPQAEMAQTSKPKPIRPQKRKPLPLGTLKFAERKGDHS